MHSATVHNRRAGRGLSPDRPHPDRVPYADNGRIPWGSLTSRQQDQVRAWLTDHGLDPARVPLDGLFAYDCIYNEWRIEIMVCHDDGQDGALPSAVVLPDGTLATVVRRVWARSRGDHGHGSGRGGRLVGHLHQVEVDGVDITPYLAGEAPYGLEHRRAQW